MSGENAATFGDTSFESGGRGHDEMTENHDNKESDLRKCETVRMAKGRKS
jgi:hypothetical protein